MARFDEVCLDLLRAGHRVRFRVDGRSMTPTVRSGETLTVAPLRRALRVGDIAFYTTNRGLTAHRVIGYRDGVLRVRGDAPGSEEERVMAEQVLGCVDSRDRLITRRAYRVARILWLVILASRARLRRAGLTA